MSKHAKKLSRLTRASRTAAVLIVAGWVMIAFAENNPALAVWGIVLLIVAICIHTAANFSAAEPKAVKK